MSGSEAAWTDLQPRLEGRIVTLEPLAAEHEAGLFAAARDPEIWRWMTVNAATSRASFHGWLEDALAKTSAGVEAAFAVVGTRSREPLGSTRYLALRPEHRGLEIGATWLARSAWGTGANAESKLLLLAHAFERLGCIRVEFKTDARNDRARAALEALPARFEGIFRKHMLIRGDEVRDSAYYAITNDDWPGVRAALHRRLAVTR